MCAAGLIARENEDARLFCGVCHFDSRVARHTGSAKAQGWSAATLCRNY